ncbi:hypothetical protein, conserved [Plasmodium gonderi]|uniref:OTU domain-containing protein n=1 Tax=Plasmodium gonderi TaxID=77519 RepID=A0A1Y1JIL6_PLAGO|nr:hypothetical protein, conserved [Plasmodium gonderi]GAW82070.1 hypothetical protein, conserved [Plasmodium gonderi]
MRKEKRIAHCLSALVVAIIYSCCLLNVVISWRVNKNEDLLKSLGSGNVIKKSRVVYNLSNEKIYLSEEYFDNIRTLQSMLLTCFKSEEKKRILNDIGIESVRSLFYENFKQELYSNLTFFFKFIRENFPYLTKKLKEEKEKKNLNEKQYVSNERLLQILEDVIGYDIEKNAFYFEKLVQFTTLGKCFDITFSMNIQNTRNPVILIAEVDSKNNFLHVKINNSVEDEDEEPSGGLGAVGGEKIKNADDTAKKENLMNKDKVPFLQNIMNPLKTSNLVVKMAKRMTWPTGYFRNLCSKHNFQAASENWVEYFYNHNETLCHVETCGSGDCLFLSLQYLLDKNGIKTNNLVLNTQVHESSFIPWYVRNVKQTDDTKFNVSDLRYLTTFYYIKYFPGYTEDYEIDEHYINEKFNLLINLEFTNYYLKKDFIYKVMKQNKEEHKNIKPVLSLISNYVSKYLNFGGRPSTENSRETSSSSSSSISKINKENKTQNSDNNSTVNSRKNIDYPKTDNMENTLTAQLHTHKNIHDLRNVLGNPLTPLNDTHSEHPINPLLTSDRRLSSGSSISTDTIYDSSDESIEIQKLEGVKEGEKLAKDVYYRITYKPGESTDNSDSDEGTTGGNTSTSTSRGSGSDSGTSGETHFLKKPPITISTRSKEIHELNTSDRRDTLKYSNKTKNLELPNVGFLRSKEESAYEHLAIPKGLEDTTTYSQEIMKTKRNFTNQGVLRASYYNNPVTSGMLGAEVEYEKKKLMNPNAPAKSEQPDVIVEEIYSDDEEAQKGKTSITKNDNDNDDYEDILQDIHEPGYRVYELIFFKLISLSANKITFEELKKMNKTNIQNLIGTKFKSKIIGSHVFMKQITEGTILPFYNFVNIKNKLNNVNRKINYAHPDIYVAVIETTFNKKIKRKKDGLLTNSLIFKHNGDCISYWSIKNNDYHFTCDNKVIETKTIEQKASALFYERTRTGHTHWGDETDYDSFQKMFNIGLITFMNNNTKFFFSKNTFKDYPIYFLIYFYSGIHFEPGIHISVHGEHETCHSSYDRNHIPSSFLQVPIE